MNEEELQAALESLRAAKDETDFYGGYKPCVSVIADKYVVVAQRADTKDNSLYVYELTAVLAAFRKELELLEAQEDDNDDVDPFAVLRELCETEGVVCWYD